MKNMKLKGILIILTVLLFVFGCTPKEPEPVVEVEPEPVVPEVKMTCNDNIENQGEEDVDCGGPCDACPTCKDDVKNQGEKGIDCGGPCTACPTCSDDILNQGEEDVDCGGPCTKCKMELVVTAEKKMALEDKMTKTTPAMFLQHANRDGLSVGDSHVYTFAITNIEQSTKKFKIDIRFDEAIDKKSSQIEVDEDTILKWFDDNQFEEYELEQYKPEYLPLGVVVGKETAPNRPTVAGTYYFYLRINALEGSSWRKHHDLIYSFKVV
jgi:hypothetical protein